MMDKNFSEGKGRNCRNPPGSLATSIVQPDLNTGCEDRLAGYEAGELLGGVGGALCALLWFGDYILQLARNH